jgi:glycosyltransferase involved in cell wall biosynthesis
MRLNVTAPVNQLGYGVVALNILKALVAEGHEPAWFPMPPVEAPPQDHPLLDAARQRTALFDPKAPSLRIWHQFDLAHHVGRGLHAAFPIFELDRFSSAELHHLRAQDVVFAPTKWAQNVLVEAGAGWPIHVANFGVDCSQFPVAPLPVSPLTTFLNVGKWEYRKGHDVLLRAFDAAFSAGDQVKLVLACHNPVARKAGYNEDWRRCAKAGRLADKVVLVDRMESQADVAALMASSDCGVFPARAEGWNLPLLEMLATGRPVIATRYAAHTEFCTDDNSLLIDVDETEDAFDGVWFHGQGAWARLGPRQFDQLVEHMRSIHRQKQDGSLGVNVAGAQTAQGLTWAATVRQIVSSLSSCPSTQTSPSADRERPPSRPS